MILIVCVDDHNGMMFNHRRQSQDRILRADILELTGGKKLWMNAYSKKQFAESDTARIRVNETFLDAAGDGEFCFVENADVSGCVMIFMRFPTTRFRCWIKIRQRPSATVSWEQWWIWFPSLKSAICIHRLIIRISRCV